MKLSEFKDGDRLVKRAIAAWYKMDGELHHGLMGSTATHKHMKYVILHVKNKVLGVYRMTNTGQLKLLRRPPRGLKEEAESLML